MNTTIFGQDANGVPRIIRTDSEGRLVLGANDVTPPPGGVIVESGTTPITGIDAYEIIVLVAATFTTLTESGVAGDAMTGFAIPAGTVLRGTFTAFTLSSGTVRAHLR